MKEKKPIEQDYLNWLTEVKKRYQSTQIKAAVQVNRSMLWFYWGLGKDIVALKTRKMRGGSFYVKLSNDLQRVLPNTKGLSVKNLYYIERFYLLVEETRNFPQLVGKMGEVFFSIPWGHIRLIIDKYGKDPCQALFYAKKTMDNNWSRNVLLNFLDTNLYEREGKAISNFASTLPRPESDLAQELTKDPYVFDFLDGSSYQSEKELKDALMENVQRFFLELGTGFALLGREYRLEIGESEEFLDFLFYQTKLHCYVVVEVKARKFEPGDMGQLGTYVASVNGILKRKEDSATVGLLICKSKDNIMAQYASNALSLPVGVSEYKIGNLAQGLFEGPLPSTEEIESELREAVKGK